MAVNGEYFGPRFIGNADPKTTLLGQLDVLLSIDFSSINVSGISLDEILSFLPAEYVTNDVIAILRQILSGDFSLAIEGQAYFKNLLQKYGPNVSLYDVMLKEGISGDNSTKTEPIWSVVDVADRLFSLDQRFSFTNSQVDSSTISSPLYELAQNGQWKSTISGISSAVLGGVGSTREELFDQLGATATNGIVDNIKDKLGRYGSSFKDAIDLIRDAGDVKEIVAEFHGNLFDQIERGINSIFSNNNPQSFEDYDKQTVLNVEKFRDDAKAYMEEKHGKLGGLLVDVLSGRVFGISEVNSFQAIVFDDSNIITGGVKKDSLFGSNFGESFLVSGGGDVILARGGNDTILLGSNYGGSKISGGDGFDVIRVDDFSSKFSYKRTTTLGEQISGPNGVVELSGIERIIFRDGTVAADTDPGEVAGSAYRLYQAAFARKPDLDGLKFWIAQMDAGKSRAEVARGFVESAEARKVYGDNSSSSDFIARLYKNVLGRDGEPAGSAFWEGELSRGMSRADILASFAESAENVKLVGLAINDGIWLG